MRTRFFRSVRAAASASVLFVLAALRLVAFDFRIPFGSVVAIVRALRRIAKWSPVFTASPLRLILRSCG